MNKKLTVLMVVLLLAAAAVAFFYFSSRTMNPLTGKINPRAYGPLCGEIVGACNNLVAINCQAEVDGPLYYVNAKTGEIVGRCGGLCDRAEGCPTPCPPKEWTCG